MEFIDLTDSPTKSPSVSPSSGLSEPSSISAGSVAKITSRPNDIPAVIILSDSDESDREDDNKVHRGLNRNGPRCKRSKPFVKPEEKFPQLEDLDSDVEEVQEVVTKVVINEDLSRGTHNPRVVPVVMDYAIIDHFWEKLMPQPILETLDESQENITDEEYRSRATRLLDHEAMAETRASIQITYRSYHDMVINEGNVYNFEPPKFDGEFLACCTCPNAAMCNTNRCECRWRSFDDNRKYDASKRVEKFMSRKKFMREEELYGYQDGKLDTDKLSDHILPVIYECHGRCPCASKCSNAVVQDGVKQHLEIFLTKKKGWGVRPTARIPKGSFICTYTGLLYPLHSEQQRRSDFQ